MEANAQERFFSLRQYFVKTVKSYATVGIIILAPFVATFATVKWFLDFFKGFIINSYFKVFSHSILNNFLRVGATILILGGGIVFIGRIFSTRKGKGLEERIDVFFKGLPVVGSIYSITKTAADTVFRKTEEFQHPVKLSYQGLRFTGFQTGKSTEDGRRMVFVPTSPNITSGFVIEVEEERIEEADESLEQAFTKVLSAGFSS